MVEHRQHEYLKMDRGRHQPVRKRSGREVKTGIGESSERRSERERGG